MKKDTDKFNGNRDMFSVLTYFRTDEIVELQFVTKRQKILRLPKEF